MAVYAKDIRNVALIGHSGEGKTTLAEAILFNAGAIDRLGKVDDGNSTMDFEQEEVARHISISLSVANCTYKGVKINLIDVPGYFDFECEMLEALSVADSAILINVIDLYLLLFKTLSYVFFDIPHCLQNSFTVVPFYSLVYFLISPFILRSIFTPLQYCSFGNRTG